MNVYEWADRLINSCPQYQTGFTQLLAQSPYPISSVERSLYGARLFRIREFFHTALNIFRAALHNKTDPILLHWLLNETPQSLNISYHRVLRNRHFTIPVFFRTDEVMPGRIAEIQCPGSLWGELQLTYDYASGSNPKSGEISPAVQFSAQLTDFLKTRPIVHHLLDNASAPAGMRYFIEKTRGAGVKYWSIDHKCTVRECNFIRSHSFFGLCAENEFRWRLAHVGKGVTYDLPPHALFDQKAPLVLPFWSLTRSLFSDEIRSLFTYTTPLLPAGIELPEGSRITIEEFARWPRSHRSYYLKYAGTDVALNWGSKAVYRLSNMSSADCLEFLHRCVSRYKKGHIWLLQKEETHDDNTTFLTRDGSTHTAKLRARFSAFYGPLDCLGILAMHRHHNKVHGKPDTVLSFVLADKAAADTITTTTLRNGG